MMITLATAVQIAYQHLSKPGNKVYGDEWVICDDKTVHGEFGWVFLYATKSFVETKNWKHDAPGKVPLIVDLNGQLFVGSYGTYLESMIYAFVCRKDDFRLEAMNPFNRFVGIVPCSPCGTNHEMAFFAKIGSLGHHTFKMGETVYLDSAGAASPSPNLGNRSLSFGVAICPNCKKAVWAEIAISQGVFQNFHVAKQPANPRSWRVE